MKTVSIIIPAKNEEKYLPLCLDSIQRLDYPKEAMEVIVVDNGSTDRTREIAQLFGATLLRDDTKHVSGLRNFGAKSAKGEILAFLDADCMVEADWLRAAARYFDENDVVAWGAPPGIPENATWVQSSWYLIRKKKMVIQEVDWLESMNLFVEKVIFLKAGGFNENLITCEDVDFSYRLASHGKIVADTSIRAIHLGEAATLGQFWRKELWRGMGNFQGLRHHGLTWKELPSIMIPAYFSIILMAFIFSLAMPYRYSVAILFLFFAPGIIVIVQKCNKKTMRELVRLAPIIYWYFMARTVSSYLYFLR